MDEDVGIVEVETQRLSTVIFYGEEYVVLHDLEKAFDRWMSP